ncbi:MAG: hypothetical protein ABL917_00110 [Parcubacteria group bacterium]
MTLHHRATVLRGIKTDLDAKAAQMSLSDADRKKLRAVNEALGRISNGTYGECQNGECTNRISPGRLYEFPWTPDCSLCASVKMRQVKQELEKAKVAFV